MLPLQSLQRLQKSLPDLLSYETIYRAMAKVSFPRLVPLLLRLLPKPLRKLRSYLPAYHLPNLLS